MIEKIFVLLNQLLWAEIAILIKKIYLENLLSVRSVGISEYESNQEGKNVTECSVSDVGGESVVVIGVKELLLG